MTRYLRNPIALAIGAILLLILIGSTLVVVPETMQAGITRFGEPQAGLKKYQPGQTFGRCASCVNSPSSTADIAVRSDIAAFAAL